MSNISPIIRQHLLNIFKTYWTLIKVMLPMIVLVKILDMFGIIAIISQLLSPLMGFVGLPGEAAIIWGSSIFVGIYGGIVLFLSSSLPEILTTAQVTTLFGMILIAHSIPVEGSIAKRIGVTWTSTLIMRIFGGFIYGFLLYHIYDLTNLLQTINPNIASPESFDDNLISWVISQIKTLLLIFVIISVLLTILLILRLIKVEHYLGILLKPLLKLIGIGDKSTYIMIVGITLGLSYGGGILIQESDSKRIPRRDVFLTILLLGLLHAIIEDTLIVMFVGAHISGALWFRIAFSLIVVAFIARVLPKISPSFCDKWIYKS